MNFRAYRIFEGSGSAAGKYLTGKFVELSLRDLDPGDVIIKSYYSGINYKDVLAATGAGKVIRRFPCIGGVDVAGIVESSSDMRFKSGDEVIVTGYGMGVDHDGGFSEYVRVPADWIVPLPSGLTLFESMALGTAGFTAALSIHRLEQNELKPAKGSVIVTGATGGVAGLAIQMLAQRGYRVVALTGKDGADGYLQSLGASEVLTSKSLTMGMRPLERAQWAGALDAVGGDTLAWLTRTMQQNGVIASFGNAGGVELHTTVMPFILRGIRLIGIDSAATDMTLRHEIWSRLAADLYPEQLTKVAHEVMFDRLPEVFLPQLQGNSRGRTVIQFAE